MKILLLGVVVLTSISAFADRSIEMTPKRPAKCYSAQVQSIAINNVVEAVESENSLHIIVETSFFNCQKSIYSQKDTVNTNSFKFKLNDLNSYHPRVARSINFEGDKVFINLEFKKGNLESVRDLRFAVSDTKGKTEYVSTLSISPAGDKGFSVDLK